MSEDPTRAPQVDDVTSFSVPHCTMCSRQLPMERFIHGATECGETCRKRKRRYYIKVRESRQCKYCGRGYSPEEQERRRHKVPQPSEGEIQHPHARATSENEEWKDTR